MGRLLNGSGPPQFQTPLTSTHQFHTEGPLLFSPKIPQFHTQNPSVQHKSLSSTPKTPQFNTNPSVPHQKSLSSTPSRSSTPKTPQFHPLSSTPKTPQFHTKKLYTNELYSYFSLREVELRVFWGGTEGFMVWN